MNGNASTSMHLHHGLYKVHLPVTDVDRSMDFSVEKLGFELGYAPRTECGIPLIPSLPRRYKQKPSVKNRRWV